MKQNPTANRSAPLTTPAAELETPPKTAFVPSSDEVARQAYFNYLNEGSKPGRDVQHWLAAEEKLLIERNLTRTHGFHNVHN